MQNYLMPRSRVVQQLDGVGQASVLAYEKGRTTRDRPAGNITAIFMTTGTTP